jgi:hypothetical protein
MASQVAKDGIKPLIREGDGKDGFPPEVVGFRLVVAHPPFEGFVGDLKTKNFFLGHLQTPLGF